MRRARPAKNTDKGDFFVRQFFDHDNKTVRQLTRADIYRAPEPKSEAVGEPAEPVQPHKTN